MNYYNEFDRQAAAWLRVLIKEGLIPNGDVDERSICDVAPTDLAGYTQCHFFAGIGGWSYALELAGWPKDRPVWTGSCPCQPFSSAGKGLAQTDERHLWPTFFNLIRKCRPEHVFGEQVASAIGHGWLDGISADLEAEGYACGAAVLGAHSVNAPHIRQRLFWVANARCSSNGGWSEPNASFGEEKTTAGEAQQWQWRGPDPGGSSKFGDVWVAHAARERSSVRHSKLPGCSGEIESHGAAISSWLGEPIQPGLERLAGHGNDGDKPGWHDPHPIGSIAPSGSASHWANFDLIPCADGKARRIESGTFPLAHGVPGRVGLLRGYGNAIVPQVAAEFIKAFVEITDI